MRSADERSDVIGAHRDHDERVATLSVVVRWCRGLGLLAFTSTMEILRSASSFSILAFAIGEELRFTRRLDRFDLQLGEASELATGELIEDELRTD